MTFLSFQKEFYMVRLFKLWVNNKNNNPKRFFLFSAKYLGKQIRESALCKIFELTTNSSSVRMKLIYS